MSNQASDIADDSYKSDPSEDSVPVVSDNAPVERTDNSNRNIDADSDQMLESDDKDAIDKSNIISGGETRTRGATKPKGTYAEPGDEEGLPTDDGTSSA